MMGAKDQAALVGHLDRSLGPAAKASSTALRLSSKGTRHPPTVPRRFTPFAQTEKLSMHEREHHAYHDR